MRVKWGGVGWGGEWVGWMNGRRPCPWRVKTGRLRGEGLTLEPEELMGRPSSDGVFNEMDGWQRIALGGGLMRLTFNGPHLGS